MRALVVEDDAASRRMAVRLLQDEGYEVDDAADAGAARVRIAEREYDLVLLDFVLPDADGLQLLREWRAAGLTFATLALTAADSDAVVEGFLRAGANDVIEKSRFGRATLRAALDGLAQPTPFPLSGTSERPRAPPEETALDEPDALVSSTGRALVVDDVPLARRHVLALLRRIGWDAAEATTAEEGLVKAMQDPYDAILVDQYLPDVEGIGLLTELRRRGVETPVIALTGHGDERLATEYILAGAVDFIPKHTLTAARLQEALALAGEGRAASVRGA